MTQFHRGAGYCQDPLAGVPAVPDEQDFIVLDTIADLRAYAFSAASFPDGQLIFVKGYYAAQDGGGGFFNYHRSGTVTDNGGTFIIPDNGFGYYQRIINAAGLNVAWFGAKGDNGTDDSDAIQRTIDAAVVELPAVGLMAVIYMEPKFYFIGSGAIGLTINDPLLVKGNGARLRYAGSSVALDVNDCFDVELRDFQVLRTYSYASPMSALIGTGIRFYNAGYWNCYNLTVAGFAQGYQFTGDGKGCTVAALYSCISNNNNYGYFFQSGAAVGSYVTNIRVFGGTITIGPFASFVGSRGIIGTYAGRTLDGINFYGTTNEGFTERRLYWEGTDSSFRDIYWDQSNGGTDIEFTATAEGNVVEGGATLAIQQLVNAGSNNQFLDPRYTKKTFTPVIEGSTSAGVGTYTAQSGIYSKNGNVVTFSLHLAWTAHTGTGNMRFAGLLFPGIAALDQQPVSVLSSNLTFSDQLAGAISSANTYGNLYTISTGGAIAFVPMDTVGELWVTGSYITPN